MTWDDDDECVNPVVFHVDEPFEASQFRICLVRNEIQCFHIRALELYGTVLPPPWSGSPM